MPHCLIEYSNGLGAQVFPEKLMKTVHVAALDSGLFVEKDIKVRMVLFSEFLPVAGANDFVFITIRLMSGRSVDLRRALSQRVFDAVQSLGLASVSVSVDITEMVNDTYVKA